MESEDMALYLVEAGICTEDELALCETIAGANEDTYENILYARTGYRSFDQLEEE